jgi:hypothetical protein
MCPRRVKKTWRLRQRSSCKFIYRDVSVMECIFVSFLTFAVLDISSDFLDARPVHLLKCHFKFCKSMGNFKDTHMLILYILIYEYIG